MAGKLTGLSVEFTGFDEGTETFACTDPRTGAPEACVVKKSQSVSYEFRLLVDGTATIGCTLSGLVHDTLSKSCTSLGQGPALVQAGQVVQVQMIPLPGTDAAVSGPNPECVIAPTTTTTTTVGAVPVGGVPGGGGTDCTDPTSRSSVSWTATFGPPTLDLWD